MTQTTQQPTDDTEKVRLERARKRVEAIRGFYVHLMIYLAVNGALALIDVLDGDGWWFDWIAIPWGIGLAAHAIAVFSDRVFGAEWEQRKIDKLLRQDDWRR